MQDAIKYYQIIIRNWDKKLNITQKKSNETTEQPSNVNYNKETEETESFSVENNDDDNDNATLDNSTGSSTNGMKVSSSL